MKNYKDTDNLLHGFLIGSLLGDGCFIQKTSKHNTYITFSHCAVQLDYLGWKYDFLKQRGLIKNNKDIKRINPKSRHVQFANAQEQYKFSVASSPLLNWYKIEEKTKIIEDLNAMGLAVYLLDDGNFYHRITKISCGKLNDQERQCLLDVLKNKFDITGWIYYSKKKSTYDYFYFPSTEYDKICQIIVENIPTNLRIVQEKIGDNIKTVDCIKIKYKYDDLIPLYKVGGNKSNWIDLRAAETVELKKGQYALIDLGIAMQLPTGYEALMAPRSSTFKNYGILQTNSIAVIDNSYCGDEDYWKYPVLATRDTIIHKNDRICQFRILKNQPAISFLDVDKLDNPNREGLGSTGVK